MVVSMTYTVNSEVVIPLRPEGDSSDPASEERTPSHNEGSGRNEQNGRGTAASVRQQDCQGSQERVGRCKLKLSKKVKAVLGIAVVLSLGISVAYNIFFYVQIKQLEARIKQLEAQVKQQEAVSAPKPFPTTSCSQGWNPYAKSCYLFSDTESTWDEARSNCSSYGASLLTMATPQEMDFINENKAPAEYWIGLRRKDKTGTWKQPDGSDVWFEIKGEGLCASLNDGVVSSTDCDSQRRWICYKPLHAV